MADKKVSQETDLGLAGIDGTVEYRVIKSGGTYKQKYSDLFSYINSHLPSPSIPTLQQVLDNNHDLTSGIVKIGTLAGDSSGSSLNLIAIGGEALNSGGGPGGSIGIGFRAGMSSSIGKGIIIGNQTGMGASGVDTVILGNTAAGGSVENSSVILGSGAISSVGTKNIYFGAKTGDYSGYGLSTPGTLSNIFIGEEAGSSAVAPGNLGNYNIALGYQALYTNDDPSRSNIVAIGNQAGFSTGHALPGGADSVYVGTGSGKNAGGDYTTAIGYQAGIDSNSANLVAIGKLAGEGSTHENSILIGESAGAEGSGADVVVIGAIANNNNVEDKVIAIGSGALNSSNVGTVIAIGTNAMGNTSQGANSNVVAIGDRAGSSSEPIATNCIYIGSNAGRNNATKDVIAIGTNAGDSNPSNSEFILASSCIRTFSSSLDAANYYSGLTLSAGQTYIYIDTGDDNALKVYQT